MNDLVVIGVAGRAGAGKDTVAQALVGLRGCHRIALADGIRAAFNDLSGPTGQLYKELTPEFNFRRAMQLLGTEGREAVGAKRHWVDHLLVKVAYLSTLHTAPRRRFVVPDVRYRFEVDELKYRVWGRLCGRFYLAKVVRPGLPPIAEAHSSEAEADGLEADVTIVNDRTVEDLHGLALASFDMLTGRVRGS